MKIAIGLGENKDILKAIEEFPFEINIATTNTELLDYLNNPQIDGVIRGSLESNVILDLKKEYPDLFRASLLEINDFKFLLAPVGIDEGDSIESKVTIIKECAKVMASMGEEARIALISGGRKNDFGRSSKINHSIDECEEIVTLLNQEYNIKNYYILIEEAIKDKANVIIAPDGITGNIIFRSLVLVAGIKSNGALTLNQPKLFIDTSRSQNTQGYINSINLMKKILDKRNKETLE